MKDTYYFSSDFVDLGLMKTGWQNINGKTYYFNKYTTEGNVGQKHNGWLRKEKTCSAGYDWYYFNSNGEMVAGWYRIGPSDKYYFSDSHTEYGVMKTGVVDINGTKYYFQSNGTLASNTTINNYKINSNGRIV